MDFPAQYPDSPAKPLTGPARARVLARQNRTSSLKPYARPSSGLSPSVSGASLQTDAADSPKAQQLSTPTAKTLAPPSNTASRSAFSPLRVAASPIALLGSVRKMVTKPLSWLTSAAAAAEPELGIPLSSSTNSLASIARKRAAAQASLKSSSDQASSERDAPTRAARAVGERLAAGLRARSTVHDDEESQLHPPTSALSSSVSMSRLAPGPAPAHTTRKQSPFDQASPLAGPSSGPRLTAKTDGAPSDKSVPWNSRSSKRMLDVGSRFTDPNDSFEVLSDAKPVSPPPTQPYHSKSHHTLRSPRSQLLSHRGSSLRPDDAMSESGSTTLSHSASFSAFGYGNEVRYSDSAFGLPPSSSPFQLSVRNPNRRSRAPFSSGLFANAGTPGRLSRAGSGSLRTASPAPSAGYSPARPRQGTPQRRNWNGMNLAAPSAPSVGDDMMREYLSSRTLPGINPTVRRNLGLHVEDPMAVSSSVTGGSVMDETESLTLSRLGKRDIDMSVDGDSERLGAVGTPSKRRMVWHPELGFVSHEELKAREPKLPSPKNEAEHLLNVLETLRKPTNTSRGVGFTKGPPTSINVPSPIPDLPASATRSAKLQDSKPAVGVAPYTRYLRKAKAVHSADEQGGMRARLKKPATASSRANRVQTDDAAAEELITSDNEGIQDDEGEEEEKGKESEDELAPPQPEPVRRSRRLQHQAPTIEEQMTQTPVKQGEKAPRATQLRSALKATPLRPSAQPHFAPVKAPETPKPASHRIPLSSASKPPARKDNFAVKASASDPAAPRERSALRQGAAKTSRTHQSSGKFSAWDEDEEEEELPDASDLAKIKLPTNMFPSGFSFGSSSAAAPASNSEAAPSAETKNATAAETNSSSSTSGGSLLSRLGAFDSSAASGKIETPKNPTALPSFSFPAPSKDTPSTAHKFSFGDSAAAPTTDPREDNTAKKPTATPASDFFSKPVEPTESKSLTEGKKDGPVPNFFGTTMKKFETQSTSTPTAASTGGFTFGAPPSSGESAASATAAANKPTFSFGGAAKPATDSSEPPASASSSPFGSFGAKSSTESTEKQQDAAAPASTGKASFFGSAPSPSGASGFSFGTPSSNVGSKRGADVDEEPATKKSTPSFTFGSPATAPKPTEQSGSFSFGAAPSMTTEKKDEPTAAKPSVPNFFGAKGEGDPSKPSSPAAPVAGSFSFGKPASDNIGGFGAPTPSGAPASTGFSFGVAKTADAAKPASSAGGFTFGSSPGPESKPAPTFSFGASKGDTASPTASAPGSGATTPNGTGVFGAPTAAPSTEAKPASSAAGFSFGTPSSSAAFGSTATGSSSGGGFGGFGKPSAATATATNGGGEMMDDSPQKTTPAAAGASMPSFTFGSATPAAASKPAPSSFTFGTPTTSAAPAGAAAASPTTFTFGAPASSASTTTNTAGTGGGFRFGSPAPAPPASAPSSGFTFGASTAGGGSTTPGVGSTPASPFLAPAGAPTTPGGSPFQFGAPPAAGASGAPFQFGAPAPTPAAAAAPSSTGFGFGMSTPSAAPPATFGGFGAPPAPTTPGAGSGAGGGFTFGAGSASMPQMPQPPAGANLFSMGAAPTGNPNSPAGAGGRQIKPLRQRRR